MNINENPAQGAFTLKQQPHVLRKATIALARKFSDLESKFNKQANQLFNKKSLDKKVNKIGDEIKYFKNEYYTIKEKDYLDPADNGIT